MTGDKVLEVIKGYEQKINSLLAKEAWEEHQQLMHAREMIPKMRNFIEQKRMDKVFRWLGFLQGILYCNGIYSIDEMANHNKPREEECQVSP